MSMAPLGGIPASVAGSPLAQTSGAALDRAARASADETHKTEQRQQALDAAGVGRTDGENHETDDRDADGRQTWQRPANRAGTAVEKGEASQRPRGDDPDGGPLLDLCG